MKPVELTPALLANITDRASAEAFIRELIRTGLLYHFDDGATACLFENGMLDLASADLVESQVDACYACWNAADPAQDCPIGFALFVVEPEDR